MKQILILTVTLVLLIGCKKEEKKIVLPCPAASSPESCELLNKRTYPNFDVTNNPAAWMTTTIEGLTYSVGSENEPEGYTYRSGEYVKFSTSGPSTTIGGEPIKEYKNLLMFEFRLVNKPKQLLGAVPGMIKLLSPFYIADTVANKLAFVERMLQPDEKQLDLGFNATYGWNFSLTYYIVDKIAVTDGSITSMGTCNTDGAQHFTENRNFEITELEKEDFGDRVRFTFWCNFDIDLYSIFYNRPFGEYFTSALNGKAKLYIDVDK